MQFEQIKKRCEQAFRYYEEAEKLASKSNYDERREEQLNAKALNELKGVIPSLETATLIKPHFLFKTYFITGELEHYFGNTNEALAFYRKAMAQFTGGNIDDSLMFKPLLYSGLIHYGRGNIDSAAFVFLKADSIQQRYKTPLDESQRLYNTLGVLDYEAGNYRQAKNHFRKALDLIDRNDPYFLDLESNYLINFAEAEVKLGEYEDALTSYQQLIHLGRNLNEIRLNMALIKIKLEKAEEAIELLDKVQLDGLKKAKLFNAYAQAFLKKREFPAAKAILDSSLTLQQDGEKDLLSLGKTWQLKGELAMSLDSPTNALEYYTNATRCFYPAYTGTAKEDNPDKFTGIFSYIELYETLLSKAKAWHDLFNASRDTAAAKHELRSYLSAYKLLDHVLETYDSDEARLFINRSRNATHDAPISIAYELYELTKEQEYLNAIYHLDQQNKASVLAFNVNRSEALRNDPAEQEANRIRKQITRLSLGSFSSANTQSPENINKQILDLELKLSKLKDRGKGLKAEWGSIPDAQKLADDILDKQTSLISYHLSGQYITTTIINTAGLSVTRKPLPAKFRLDLGRLIQSFQDPASTIPVAVSASMFHLLFDEVLKFRPARLIVIPDNDLNYLPFESLQDEQGRYAIEKFSIQYQYSTALLEHGKHSFDKSQMISFAPFASSGADSFMALHASRQEIRKNPGKQFYDLDATKEEFIKYAGISNVIHLATHAKASRYQGQSFLAFRDKNGKADLLYEDEIYGLDLKNTDLIILSACETASGELLEGEGVMSLSRSFSYAGCDNVITTLWKADDRSTAYLTMKVQEYIDEGTIKDEAIRQAKLDLLKDPRIGPREKHPYYWSHMVLIGNYEASASKKWPWVVIVALMIAGATGFVIRKKYFSAI